MARQSFLAKLIRRKTITVDAIDEGKLKRCLSTFDLTALGVGSTLGLGVYVLAGQVAATKAGPAVILSFVIAAIASVFAGLCYAEFAARVPKAGSAYVYSYTTVGELIAFFIGWNLILEYVIGTASIARGFTGYLDSLIPGSLISTKELEWMPLGLQGISGYFDLFSFGITMCVCVMLAFGVKESANFNTIFTAINLYVVVYVVIVGCFKANFHYWNLPPSEVPPGNGAGGFFPYGFSGLFDLIRFITITGFSDIVRIGVMRGAATCFYGFIGFDAIASTGEEAKNPQKSMPIAITVSLGFILLAYFSVAAVSTLMWPYWDLNESAPLSYIFDKIGWDVAKYVSAVGAITSLSTALLGTLFPLPRVLYAMSSDGLLFKVFGVISDRTRTPLFSTAVAGLFAGLMAAIFSVEQLVDMQSIGTMLAYTLVTISVLILRYQQDHMQVGGRRASVAPDQLAEPTDINEESAEDIEEESEEEIEEQVDETNSPPEIVIDETIRPTLSNLFNWNRQFKRPNQFTAKVSVMLIGALCITICVLDTVLVFLEEYLFSGNIYAIAVTSSVFMCLTFLVIWLNFQPQTRLKLGFKVPFLPILPIVSIFFNFYLMLKLPTETWIRFGIWIGLGFAQYFFYGIHNSVGALSEEEKQALYERKIAEKKRKDHEKSPLINQPGPSNYSAINS